MKSSKKLQISSHLLFVYIHNQDRKWRMSVLVFSSALDTTYAFCNIVLSFAKDTFLSKTKFAWTASRFCNVV